MNIKPGRRTYAELIQNCKNSSNTDLVTYLERFRDKDELKRGTTKRVLVVLEHLISKPNFLPTTCRGCGNEDGTRWYGDVPMLCSACFMQQYDTIRKCRCAELLVTIQLTLYRPNRAEFEQYLPQLADFWTSCTQETRYSDRYDLMVKREEAEELAKVYRDRSVAVLRANIADGSLTKIQSRAKVEKYRFSARIAEECVCT